MNSPSSSGAPDGAAPKSFPYRFGEVGIMMELLSVEQVKAALKEQKGQSSGGQRRRLIGEILVRQRLLDGSQVEKILASQRRFREKQGKARPQDPPAASGVPQRSAKKRLGHFELIRQLGEGSMGAVFEARDTEKDRIVALKVLPKDLANDPEFLARFQREVKTLDALDHPNIVAFLGSGQVAGYWYLCMEFVRGESLSQRLAREKRLPEKEALQIAQDICQALAHAHGKGMIHRDIKPENVLLSAEGGVKVTDFGLAKSQQDTSKLTAVGLSVGTPHYLSPEQAMGAEHVDHRADLYSVGATLFHLVTGRVPFDSPSSTKIMIMHVQDPPPDPRSVVPGVSRGVAQLILRLMSKKPEQRYQGAAEVAAVLEALRSGQAPAPSPGEASRTGRQERLRVGWAKRLTSGCLGRSALLALLLGAGLAGCWYWAFPA